MASNDNSCVNSKPQQESQQDNACTNSKLQQESQQQQQYGSFLYTINADDCSKVDQASYTRTRCKPSYAQRLLSGIQLATAMFVATYVGVTARIYLQMLAQWSGFSEFESLYAQLVGSAILGVISTHKQVLMINHMTFYTAVATGMCGSITTFSSWNAEGAFSLLQVNRTSLTPLHTPDNASRVVTFMTIILIGVAAPLAALKFGHNIGSTAPFRFLAAKASCQSSTCATTFAIVIIWVLSTGGILAGCLVPTHHEIMFSLILGNAGTLVQWMLSFLDTKLRGFPIGTFTANVCGTWLIGVLLAAQGYSKTGNELVLGLLKGLVTGLCGCLTTVSTFVGQLNTLPFSMGCLYAVLSIAVAQAGLLAVLATYLHMPVI